MRCNEVVLPLEEGPTRRVGMDTPIFCRVPFSGYDGSLNRKTVVVAYIFVRAERTPGAALCPVSNVCSPNMLLASATLPPRLFPRTAGDFIWSQCIFLVPLAHKVRPAGSYGVRLVYLLSGTIRATRQTLACPIANERFPNVVRIVGTLPPRTVPTTSRDIIWGH